jgi:hypothetical protein
MGDLAGNVMGNMCLRDTVGGVLSKPAHHAAQVAEEATVERGKGTTSESELRGAVMREERIGVLQERDQNEPVVHPKRDKTRVMYRK